MNDEFSKLEKLLIKQRITEEEALAVIKSSSKKPGKIKKLKIAEDYFTYGYFSDCHIGHSKFLEPLFNKMVEVFNKEDLDFVLNIGDTLEGMSGRPGHIYELTHVGFDQQYKYARKLLSKIDADMYGIDGNHDGWYYKKNNGGIIVGNELERDLDNYNNLGQMEGLLNINNIKLMLFHPNDGTAYATSYKLQKLIESLTGGEKPNIVHEGHYHKALYMFLRNVHGFESGTLCGQSEFMRGKKIPAHIGFGVVKVYHDKKSVDRVEHQFYPGY